MFVELSRSTSLPSVSVGRVGLLSAQGLVSSGGILCVASRTDPMESALTKPSCPQARQQGCPQVARFGAVLVQIFKVYRFKEQFVFLSKT